MDETPHLSPLETYRALSDSIFALYEGGQQREALALLDDVRHELRPWQAELAHLRACLHGSLGERDEALATLGAAHAAGGWWDPSILVEDDDLASLDGLPEFASLVESSRARWVQANAQPDRTGDRLVLPSGGARGIVVALHGAEEDAVDALTAWGSATAAGFGVLALRSSQRTSPSARHSAPRPAIAPGPIRRARPPRSPLRLQRSPPRRGHCPSWLRGSPQADVSHCTGRFPDRPAPSPA